MNSPVSDTDSLDPLFSPTSIAIVGASDNAAKIGGIPLDYLQRFGYGGRIHAVNPRGGTVQGRTAVPDLSSIGEPVDLAIVAVPSALVEMTIDDAVRAGVRGVVLFSSGFAEVDEAGRLAQARIAERARGAGMRIVGPNCLGLMNVARAVYATFSPAPSVGRAQAGRIGLASQSGAFGAYAYSLARERGIGLSLWVTTGNESDVDVADCIAWMARDPATEVIMAYFEGCRDGARLRHALALARAAGKPVIAVKVGRTGLGAEAAASHTAALAGDDQVFDAVFAQYGVLRARSVREFFDLASSAAIAGRPRGRSIALFTVSGGVGALMADEAVAQGLDVAPLGEAAQRQIREWVPFAAPRNPLDITGQVTNDPGLIERSARLMLQDRPYAMWLGFFAAAGASERFWPTLHGVIAGLRSAHPTTVLAVSTLLPAARRLELEALGCLVFDDPTDAIRTLAGLATTATTASLAGGAAPALSDRPMPTAATPTPAATAATLTSASPEAPATPGAASPLAAGVHSEADSLRVLAAAGVPVVAFRVARDEQEAQSAATTLGGLVAVKVLSPDIAHKSDVGGVVLGVSDAASVRQAFRDVIARAHAARPKARVEGALIARMEPGGVECIAGVHCDPVFGLVLMFGLGGVHVEVLRDVSLRPLPVTRAEVVAMVDGLRARPLLEGFRGQPPADVDAIVDALLALAAWAQAAGGALTSAEINPLIVRRGIGAGCVAVDALVIGETTHAASPIPAIQGDRP